MASTSAVSMSVLPVAAASTKSKLPSSEGFFRPLAVRPSKPLAASRGNRLQVQASLKEKMVSGLTAAALTASVVIPDAEAATSGVSASLKNFLLSIVAGGIVLTAIIGAVVGVSNFDPVKRG